MVKLPGSREIKVEAAAAKAEREEAERPFNQPHACVDAQHWAKMSYWTLDEAVALSLGRDPKLVNWPVVQHYVRISQFASEFANRREIVLRAKAMGQLSNSTTPSSFVSWAARMRFPMPSDVVEAIDALGLQVADWKSLFERQKKITAATQECLDKCNADRVAEANEHLEVIDEIQEKMASTIQTYKETAEKYKG